MLLHLKEFNQYQGILIKFLKFIYFRTLISKKTNYYAHNI